MLTDVIENAFKKVCTITMHRVLCEGGWGERIYKEFQGRFPGGEDGLAISSNLQYSLMMERSVCQ